MAAEDIPQNDNAAPAGQQVRPGHRRAARIGVPIGVAGVAALVAGLVPALAAGNDGPKLPSLTAQQLLAKVAGSHVDTYSGTVKLTTDLGLPDVSGMLNGALDSAKAPKVTASQRSAADAASARLLTLLSGTHTARVAADGPQHQRVDLQGSSGFSLVHDGSSVWSYDAGGHTATHATLPKSAAKTDQAAGAMDPDLAARRLLSGIEPSTLVKVAGTTRVAGQDAYVLRLQPRAQGSTIGYVSVDVARDGFPLALTVEPASGGKPAVDLRFSSVSFAKPAADTFRFAPPQGTTVRNVTPRDHRPAAAKKPSATQDTSGLKTLGKGWSTVLETAAPGNGTGASARQLPAQLRRFGTEVHGSFGSGTIFSTRLVNVLVTEHGQVFAGAVDRATLTHLADTAG